MKIRWRSCLRDLYFSISIFTEWIASIVLTPLVNPQWLMLYLLLLSTFLRERIPRSWWCEKLVWFLYSSHNPRHLLYFYRMVPDCWISTYLAVWLIFGFRWTTLSAMLLHAYSDIAQTFPQFGWNLVRSGSFPILNFLNSSFDFMRWYCVNRYFGTWRFLWKLLVKQCLVVHNLAISYLFLCPWLINWPAWFLMYLKRLISLLRLSRSFASLNISASVSAFSNCL